MTGPDGGMTAVTGSPANEVPESPAAPLLAPDSRLELVGLSIVEQDGAFVVGDRAQGTFVQLPEIGVTVIERLRAGASIAEVTATLRGADGACPDDDVDVLDFAGTLLDLGFVHAIDGVAVSGTGTMAEEPRRRWLTGPRPERIRWLFGPVAWTLYLLLGAGCVVTEIVFPPVRPHSGDFFFLSDPLASIAILTIVSFAVSGGHESFHWLAGCAQGVGARFAISRRLYFLVFETDLTQLWSVPPRRRYGPLVAGMAFDTVVLSGAVAGRVLMAAGVVSLPSVAGRALAAVALVATTNLAWQFCVFLRNDLYLAVSTALGCVNLWQVTMLTLKKVLWRLSPAEQEELDTADDRSRRHARWYSWVCVLGVAGAGWYAVVIVGPAIWQVVRSLAGHLTASPLASGRFWEALAFGVLALLPVFLTLYVFVRDMITNRPAS